MRDVTTYDDVLFSERMRAFYGDDFYNVGLWDEPAFTVAEACAALVRSVTERVPAAPRTVLDAGCGIGGSTREIVVRWPQAHVVGIGVSDRQLGRCREVCARAEFVRMDAAALAFGDESFDAIVAVESALHFDTRERFFAEAARVVCRGGALALADLLVPSAAWPGAWTVPAANIGWTPGRYAAALAAAGFEDIEVDDVTERTWDVHLARFVAHAGALAEDASWAAVARALAAAERPAYVIASARRPR